MLRDFVTKFRKSVTKRAITRRKDFSVPVRITFEVDSVSGKLNPKMRDLSIHGVTADLSQTGIGFIVPFIRLDEFYLVGEGRLLKAEMALPKGKIDLFVLGTRYEQMGTDVADVKYLVGAEIVSMSSHDRELYQDFILQTKGQGGSLELGVDQG